MSNDYLAKNKGVKSTQKQSEKLSQSEQSTALLPVNDSEMAYQNAQSSSSVRYLKPGYPNMLSVKTMKIRAPSPQQYSKEYSIQCLTKDLKN